MRLINAESVKKGIGELKQSPWYNEKNSDHFIIRKDAVEVVEYLCIDKEQTIDAVPVVRCKDCVYTEYSLPSMVYCPNIVGGWVDENGYCSFGESKTAEE